MTRVALLGGGPAGMLVALLAHRGGAELCWMSNGPDAPQTPHIHILRPEIASLLEGIDTRLGAAIKEQTEQGYSWRRADGTIHRAPRLTRTGLQRALEARLAEDGLQPVAGNAEDLARHQSDDPAVTWIDATGGTRALARVFEAAGRGKLELEDTGQSSVWQTRYWPEHGCDVAFTHIVTGRYYMEASSHGLRITGCGDATIAFPDGMVTPDGPAAMTWRFIAPPIRRAIWRKAQNAPHLMLLGDALLQTPPAMGFGLLGVAQQAAILSEAWAEGVACVPELDSWAQNLWASAAVQDALQALPA